MQTTLLSLAIAAILALLAALFGPYFVDWSQYRDVVEARASQLLGSPVRVRGPIDLRLLPIPWISAADVEIGDGQRVTAAELTVEFAFAPLLRGEWRATDLRLSGPDIALSLSADGRVQSYPIFPAVDPDVFSIERLVIDKGRISFLDAASGVQRTIEDVSFAGDLKSLMGPLRGEGMFRLDAAPYKYRLSLSRSTAEGSRGRLTLEPENSGLTIEADGLFRLADAVPKIDGGLVITRSKGASDQNHAARLTSKLRASPAGVAFDQIEIQIGAADHPVRFTGAAELTLGAMPRLEGSFAARQLELDTLLGEASSRAPLDAIAGLARLFADAPRLPVAAQFSISIDSVGIAGAMLTNLNGRLTADDSGWSFDQIEMRAPGLSHVKVSGRLESTASGMAFSGPATVEAGDAKALFAWLEGRSASPSVGANARMRASGILSLSSERAAVDNLSVDIDRKTLDGRMAYVVADGPRPARLEAALKAGDIDLDALYGSVHKLLEGAKSPAPEEISLDLDFAKATLFGVSASGIAAHLQIDRNELSVQRLAIADLSGASFLARGRIADAMDNPHGSLTVDLDARKLDGIIAALSAISPEVAEQVRASAARLTPLTLRTQVRLDRAADGQGAQAMLDFEGRAGVLRVGLIADSTGGVRSLPLSDWKIDDWKIDARLDSDDGEVLAALTGLERFATVDRRAAWLRLIARGSGSGPVQVDSRLAAGGLDAAARGSLTFGAGAKLAGAFHVSVKAANASRLRPRGGASAPLPIALTTQVSIRGPALTLTGASGTIGGHSVRGRLNVALEPSTRINGEVEADFADADGLIATLLNLPSPGEHRSVWSSEPFSPRFQQTSVDVNVKLKRASVLSHLSLSNVAFRLRAEDGHIALEAMSAAYEGGRLTGQVSFTHEREGSTAKAQLALRNAAANLGVSADGRPKLSGVLTLQCEVEAQGLSPATMAGSLKGAGTLTIERAEIAGIDAQVFARAIRAADQGLPLDAHRVSDFVGSIFAAGKLPIGHADATLTVDGGQMRVSPLTFRSDDVSLTLTANMDLAEGQADARLLLSGPHRADAAVVPEISLTLKGPIGEARREVDVTGLVAWLTLRSIERQSKRLEAIENAERETDRSAPQGASASITSADPAHPVRSDEAVGSVERAPPLPPAIEIPAGRVRPAAPVQRKLPRSSAAEPNGASGAQGWWGRPANRTFFEPVPRLER